MQPIIEEIKNLFSTFSKAEIKAVDKLPQSGSERSYYRIHADKTYIATHGINIKENEAFIYFTRHFKAKQLAVPQLLCVSNDKSIYIQEDLGDSTLLNKLEAENFTEAVYALYKTSLQQLALLQMKGDEGLDYNKCLTNTEFGKQAIMADLLYFKYYFLDTLGKPYDKQKLINDFEVLSGMLADTEYKYFMFRDFQSRNIMVKDDNSAHFIDYQGGMKGAPQYDVASLLWQAKANLNDEWKNNLLNDYMDAFEKTINKPLDRNIFKKQYNGYVLIRLLQVLGAYGFRGLFERKAHFLTSIPLALQNLKAFISNQNIRLELTEFKKAMDICTADEVIQHFTPMRATDETPLRVHINSFSYKRGIPIDTSDHGGGFVFDCRSILNPGRIEKYKTQSGQDKEVKTFLEQQTEMPAFLNSVYDIIDISVTDYLKRGFRNLQINFGCTGGQHRSVYASEALARHLKNKFNVKLVLNHMNMENWVR